MKNIEKLTLDNQLRRRTDLQRCIHRAKAHLHDIVVSDLVDQLDHLEQHILAQVPPCFNIQIQNLLN